MASGRKKKIGTLVLVTGEEVTVTKDEKESLESIKDIRDKLRYGIPIKVKNNEYINAYNVLRAREW